MYTRFVCSCPSLCIVYKYVCLCSNMFACSYMYFLSRFLYVNPIPFSTLQRQNLPPGKPHSSLAFSSTATMVRYFLLMYKACTSRQMASLSKVSRFIRIRDAVYLLTGVRSWPSWATCSLWMSRTVLSECPVASAVCFATAILLLVDLHAFSFSKKAWTFSTICLVYDLSLTIFLPGVPATLCSSELLELLAPSVDLLFGPIPTYYV